MVSYTDSTMPAEVLNQKFILISKITLVSIYLVILAGGIVRMTESGMGCPDWPKCFGMWIPPTDVSQLPNNYQEIYAESYSDTTFNPFHTWTEYVNRLIGAVSGILVFATFVLSVIWIKSKRVIIPAIAQVFLMGFQGWLGSQVVASNLQPTKITIHMLVALLIVLVQLVIIKEAIPSSTAKGKSGLGNLRPVLWSVIILSIVQIVFGTQVRQQIDEISLALNHSTRELWIAKLGTVFYIHRSFSIIVLGLNGWLIYELIKHNSQVKLAVILGILLGLEILVGVILNYLNMPAIMQPTHLVLATIIFGVQIQLKFACTKQQF